MELVGWVALGLFYAGPYILGAVLFMAAVVALGWGAFLVNRKVGLAVLMAILVGSAVAIQVFVLRGPTAFNRACNSGTGVRVLKQVQTDGYALAYASDMGAGLARMSDATLEDSIINVANRRVAYAEVQDWTTDESRRYGVAGELAKMRTSAQSAGYFKVYVDTLGAPQCRWLMPEDTGKLPYHLYLAHGREHALNDKLRSGEPGKECVAIEYLAAPSARYAVEFALNQPVEAKVVRHEIRVVDLQDARALVGNSVAYEYQSTGVYDSVAFWVGNGKGHSRCPINMLEGKPVQAILGLESLRRRKHGR